MKTTFKQFEISSKKTDKVAFNPWGDRTGNHYQHKVVIKNTGENVKVSIDFYGSQHDYDRGVSELDESDLLNAFSCLVSDAISGSQSFDEFCSDMGYNTDSRKAYKIWTSCKRQLEKTFKLVLSVDELYDLSNELSELV